MGRRIDERTESTDRLSDRCRRGGPREPPSECHHKQSVQNDIRDACGDREEQAELGLLRGDEEALKDALEHINNGRAAKGDPSVEDAVVEHGPPCAQPGRDLRQPDLPQERDDPPAMRVVYTKSEKQRLA